MPVIYSYPSKTSPSSGDLLLISDISASNQTKKITIGDVGTTIQTSLGLVDGSGTLNKISKWSDANTLTDSIITEDPAAPGISVAGSLSITGASNYLFIPSILDSLGSQGTANQVLTAGSGGAIAWANDTDTTYIAGDGIDIDVSTNPDTIKTDLKANGGVVIESTELAVDLGASSITGTLAVGDGGTGNTSTAEYAVFVGTNATTVEPSTSNSRGIRLPKGSTAQRATPSSTLNGLIRYNSTTNKLEVVIDGAWNDITTSEP